MIPKIGFALQGQYDRPLTQVVELLHKAGFSAVSPLWSPELDMAALADCVCENGMTIQYIHAPHKNIPLLWQPELSDAVEALGNILCAIDDCAKYQVPILVIHGWQGLHYTFPTAPLDFRAFDHIVAYAKEKGVQIAFENLEGEEYLDALMTRYQDCAHVGFCWDSGHDYCYPATKTDFLKRFGNRLIMVHLNDNFGVRDPSGIPNGKDDLHFLPYDGNLDWDNILLRLKAALKQEILNFEIKIRSHSKDENDMPYLHLPFEEFAERAAARALQIAQKYAEIMQQA